MVYKNAREFQDFFLKYKFLSFEKSIKSPIWFYVRCCNMRYTFNVTTVIWINDITNEKLSHSTWVKLKKNHTLKFIILMIFSENRYFKKFNIFLKSKFWELWNINRISNIVKSKKSLFSIVFFWKFQKMVTSKFEVQMSKK
jgi:hypothetical protein